MNQYKTLSQLQSLKIIAFTLLMALVCCLVALNEVRKENNRSKQFIALLQVHSTDFGVAWAQIMRDYPELSYDETLELAKVRARNVSRDQEDVYLYDEGSGDMR